jgi:hypothetical protein
MTQAETEKVNAILAQSPRPMTKPTPKPKRRIHYGREELIGTEPYEQTMEAFVLRHDEISSEDLDAFHTHLLRCFPNRDITVQICPADEPAGILIFSVYGFTETDQRRSPEKAAFFDELPAALNHVLGPVTIFPRTGPYSDETVADGAENRWRAC